MPRYDLRLYKKLASKLGAFDLKASLVFEANDNDHAAEIAPNLESFSYDDSDCAMLFSEDRRFLRILKV